MMKEELRLSVGDGERHWLLGTQEREVGEIFEWHGPDPPAGTYRIDKKMYDPEYGGQWSYVATKMPDAPMTEEDMKDIST